MADNISRFFLGANTPTGFCGYHNELINAADGWRGFLIKSGPGTGKSTLMKKILNEVVAQGLSVEALHCSSDPSSLDGVTVPAIRTLIFDATAPHVLEPRYWGTVEEIVDLSRCMDSERLQAHREEIIQATDACSAAHASARRYMAAAGELLADNRRIAAGYTNVNKVTATAASMAKNEFGGSSGQGREERRFLSALTPKGWVCFEDTLSVLCPKLYVIEDENGAASSLLLSELRQHALAAGLEIITCTCPLHGSVEHLLIPSLGVGFATANSHHAMVLPAYRRIHATRFTDTVRLREHRETMRFHRKAAEELLEKAGGEIGRAKAIHDQMEEYSNAAMDWDEADKIQKKVLATFLARIAAQQE